MEFLISHQYPKDTKNIFNLLTSQEYLEKKFSAIGSENVQILECGPNKGTFIVKNQRDVQSDPPSVIKKFVKATNTLTTTDNWEITDSDKKEGTFDIQIKGMPIKMNGTLSLKPNDSGCTYDIRFNISVKIPLVGKKIAQLIKEDVQTNQEEDYMFTKEYLKAIN